MERFVTCVRGGLRTSSIYILAGETRCAGCLCTSSGWFKHIEPHRTYTNHLITELATCVEVYHRSAVWLDCTEPSLCKVYSVTANLHEPQHHRASKVCRGFSHEFGVVRLYRTFSMYLVTGETRSAGCFCKSSGWFKHSEPHRTYANHNITEIARCGEVCHRSSGWFDCTERSLATSLQGKQGVCRVLLH